MKEWDEVRIERNHRRKERVYMGFWFVWGYILSEVWNKVQEYMCLLALGGADIGWDVHCILVLYMAD